MANADRAQGFRPMRHLTGGVIRNNEYQILTSGTTGYNDNIFSGDVVKLNTDGTIERAAAGDTNLIGIFDGVQYVASDGSIVFSRNWVASTGVKTGSQIKALVYDDPNITYYVQTATGTAFTQAMVGSNGDFVAGTGVASTGQSADELDISAVGSATANFRIIALVDEVNNALGEHAKVEVRFNEHVYLSATGV